MSEHCRAEFADGSVIERDYANARGLKINGKRPVTVWLVNPHDNYVNLARHLVCPYVGAVFVGYMDV